MCIMPLLPLFLHEECCLLCLLPHFIQLVQLLNSFLLCFIKINSQICSHLKSMYLEFNKKHYLFAIHQLIWCKSCSVLPRDSISLECIFELLFPILSVHYYSLSDNSFQCFICGFHLAIGLWMARCTSYVLDLIFFCDVLN